MCVCVCVRWGGGSQGARLSSQPLTIPAPLHEVVYPPGSMVPPQVAASRFLHFYFSVIS